MIYLDIKPEDLKKKYKIRPYIVNCRKCGKPNSPSIPFATFESIGLLIEKCEYCGDKLRLSSSVPRTAIAINEWNEIMSGYF